MVVEILEQLTAGANDILSRPAKQSLNGLPALQPFAVGALGNFPYYWQNPSNLLFNHLTYNWISANLKAGATPAQLDQSFNNYYIEALSAVNYQLSTADQTALSEAQENVANGQLALLSAWQAAYGSIPPATPSRQPIDIIIGTIVSTWASPPTSWPALQQAADLSALLNNTPPSGQTILPVLAQYLAVLSGSVALQNAVPMNEGYVRKALVAAQTPAAANGGLMTDNNLLNPAYLVSTPLDTIIDGLKNTSGLITLNMLVSSSAADGYSISVNDAGPIDVSPSDFFFLTTADDIDQFQSLVASSSQPVQLEMTFTGVTMVNFGPVPYNLSTGSSWYWMPPIIEALTNGSRDVSGFKFSPVPQIDFSAKGPFGYLTGVGISNYPSVRITAAAPASQSLAQTFRQSTSFDMAFLGVPLNNSSQPAFLSSAQVDSADSTVTVSLAPQPQFVAGQSVTSLGWVLGVQTEYPAASGSSS